MTADRHVVGFSLLYDSENDGCTKVKEKATWQSENLPASRVKEAVMFSPNNSLFGGLAKVILTLVIIGFVVGLAISGSDLANFITNSAKAQAIKNQNDLQAQKDAVDIKNYQTIQETITQTKIDQLRADSAAYQKSLEQGLQFQAQKAAQELETARWIRYIETGIGSFIAFCFGTGLVILMILIGRSRLILAQAKVKQTDPWEDAAWRKEQIRIFRERERVMRKTLANVTNIPIVPPFYPSATPIPWNSFQHEYVEMPNPKRKEE